MKSTLFKFPRKGICKGYEIDKIGTTGIDSVKPRTTRKKETQFVPVMQVTL